MKTTSLSRSSDPSSHSAAAFFRHCVSQSHKTRHRLASAALIAVLTGTAPAQVPQLINYQGRVAVGTPAVNFNGSGLFRFALVNAAGSTSYWSNDGTSSGGSQPTAAVTLTVTKGLYSVLLGDTTLANMTSAIPATVFNNADVRLRVWFNDGTNGSQRLVPDQRIAAVGYAMMAGTAATVPDGAITSAKIAGGAVGSAQIAAGAVGNGQLAANAVQSSNIAANAVQSANIAAGAVGTTQIAAGAIAFSDLAKPPQSGTVNGSGLSFDFGQASFSVTFPQAFAAVPAVALSLAPVSKSFPADAVVQLTSSSATQFAGKVFAPVSFPITLDSTGDVGQSASMTVVNGYPAICYFDYTNGDLKYVRANDNFGSFWSSPIIVDGVSSSVGEFASMAVVNGNPAISYYDYTNRDLKYVRATNINGTTWGTPVTIDSGGDVGYATSLEVVGANPAISYFDTTNGNVKYVRATEASGTTWGTPVIVNYAASGGSTSLAVFNGNPVISYYDSRSNGMLKYVRAADATGGSWGTPVILQSALYVNSGNSLAVVNGAPAISYFDSTNNRLHFIRGSGSGDTTWEAPVIVDDASGFFNSLAVVGGNPAISYFDGTTRRIKYVRATDASGMAWGMPVVLDGAPVATTGVSLAVVNNAPAVAYYYGNNVGSFNGDLKYIRQLNPPDFKVHWIALPP